MAGVSTYEPQGDAPHGITHEEASRALQVVTASIASRAGFARAHRPAVDRITELVEQCMWFCASSWILTGQSSRQ